MVIRPVSLLIGLSCHINPSRILRFFFFFNDTATTEIYTLSLHDALPISFLRGRSKRSPGSASCCQGRRRTTSGDRKSTRLNSSHLVISYAVFCLKKKKLHLHFMYLTTTILAGGGSDVGCSS